MATIDGDTGGDSSGDSSDIEAAAAVAACRGDGDDSWRHSS